ncbi:PQQ-binding-like beta-propeller repeat protein [Steroidobacter flavus]|uniref:PQQ-binding-like beta-propeller repeat protein n=1 Tax=Steroidobacter flavus TaxID=1842136 RepID=A0ABV8SVK6_9GAMM
MLTFAVAPAARPLVSNAEDFSRPAAEDWVTVGGDWGNTRYSTLTQITRNNVRLLGATWTSDVFDENGTSSVTPIVENGTMFVTAGRMVYALDARTGARLWSYKTVPDARAETMNSSLGRSREEGAAPGAIPNFRGVAVSAELIFVGLVDGHVIALNKKTGTLAWVRQTGIEEPKQQQQVSTAPIYVDGIVLTGLANGDANLRGRLTALEASTGKVLWQVFTIPGPGADGHETWPSFNNTWKFGGGGVWANAAVDRELGIAYFTTGNPVPAFAGDWRPGDNLFTCSVLAVDLRTGKLKWHYQLVHHDVFEADAGTPVVLSDLEIGRKRHKAVGILRSDGYLFQLDRRTGEPLLQVIERSVPQLSSQRTSPTQPHPVGGESILMDCEDWRKKKIPKGFVVGCMWTPPASPPPSKDAQNVLAPFPSVRVSQMAYSPQTRFFYAQGTSFLTWPRRSQDPYQLTFDTTVFNLKAYGEFAAIDGRTGKIAWKKRVYTGGKLPIYLRGALLATAGGLVFRSSGDGNVESYDAETGDLLWTFQTGAVDASGSPVSYEVDGEQYIAVPMGSAVWAFKLGGEIPAAAARQPPSTEGEFRGQWVQTNVIETTSMKHTQFASVNRYFIDEFAFNPTRARVAMSTAVLFVNNGNMDHEIVATDGSWGTGPLSPAQEVWLTFDSPGVRTYTCKQHPWTHGQLAVAKTEPAQGRSTRSSDGSWDNSRKLVTQVALGKQQFDNNCSACHERDLSGRGMAPSLIGDAFASRWRGAKVGQMFERIRTTMPLTEPGSLDRKAYLNIVAYLLQANDMAAGEIELEDSAEVLNNVSIADIKRHYQ